MAVTSERQRLARDLHDVVAGHLSSIAIQSEAALRLRDSDPAQAMAVLESVRADSVAALNEMQSMVTLLRTDDTVDETTTAGRLQDLTTLTDSAAASGTVVQVRGKVPESLDPEVDLTAYRIIQETLTNAVKHASGQPITLTFADSDGHLHIDATNSVTPAGTRISRSGDEGHGVRNITERAAAIGGSARSARDGHLWRVHARLPMNRRHAR